MSPGVTGLSSTPQPPAHPDPAFTPHSGVFTSAPLEHKSSSRVAWKYDEYLGWLLLEKTSREERESKEARLGWKCSQNSVFLELAAAARTGSEPGSSSLGAAPALHAQRRPLRCLSRALFRNSWILPEPSL